MSVIVAGPASRELAYNTAKLANLESIDVYSKTFPDGEVKITISDAYRLEEKHAIIIQSTYPPVNEHIMQLLFMLGKVRKHAKTITLIIPYLAYARQDREFLKGESVSINHIADILASFKVDEIITIDIHSDLALSYLKNAKNLSAIPLLADAFKDISDAIIVSPDQGGRDRAIEFAKVIGKEAIALQKVRDRNTGEVKVGIDDNIASKVKGKNVIMVDDIISTGGSIVKASNTLKDICKDIHVTCTHALLLNNAYEKIINSGVKSIVATNTIPSKVSKVDVSSLISKQIRIE